MSAQMSMFDSGGGSGYAAATANDSPTTEPIDWYNLIASERGMPVGWQWHTLEAVGSDALVTGAVCRVLFKSGPRKGTENWAKRDRATERQIVITRQQFVERKAQWERETGRCAQCFGSGEAIVGVNEAGRLTQPCGPCKATGAAP